LLLAISSGGRKRKDFASEIMSVVDFDESLCLKEVEVWGVERGIC
jgi:hypothetical protein